MDGVRKKIRVYLLGMLVVVIIQSLLGFSSLYSGLLFNEYDSVTAEENLAIIQETDPAHYNLIMDPEDPTYMDEFRRIHTTRGNRTLVVYGIMLILLSLMTAVPGALAFVELGADTSENSGEGDEKKEQEQKEGDEESF